MASGLNFSLLLMLVWNIKKFDNWRQFLHKIWWHVIYNNHMIPVFPATSSNTDNNNNAVLQCVWMDSCEEILIRPQTKSCSSFPEWLRLSFRPDRILWAGEVRLCSRGIVFGDWHRTRLCPAVCLSLVRFMLSSSWHPAATSWADSCVVRDDLAAAGDVNVESSPSMYCTTSRGLSGTSTLLSVTVVTWRSCRVLSQWTSKFWESLCVCGSGEELRLLSALPGWPLAGATGCLATRPGLESRVPVLWCRWYFTGCLVKR